jgi:hypothetical protein
MLQALDALDAWTLTESHPQQQILGKIKKQQAAATTSANSGEGEAGEKSEEARRSQGKPKRQDGVGTFMSDQKATTRTSTQHQPDHDARLAER